MSVESKLKEERVLMRKVAEEQAERGRIEQIKLAIFKEKHGVSGGFYVPEEKVVLSHDVRKKMRSAEREYARKHGGNPPVQAPAVVSVQVEDENTKRAKVIVQKILKAGDMHGAVELASSMGMPRKALAEIMAEHNKQPVKRNLHALRAIDYRD